MRCVYRLVRACACEGGSASKVRVRGKVCVGPSPSRVQSGKKTDILWWPLSVTDLIDIGSH